MTTELRERIGLTKPAVGPQCKRCKVAADGIEEIINQLSVVDLRTVAALHDLLQKIKYTDVADTRMPWDAGTDSLCLVENAADKIDNEFHGCITPAEIDEVHRLASRLGDLFRRAEERATIAALSGPAVEVSHGF